MIGPRFRRVLKFASCLMLAWGVYRLVGALLAAFDGDPFPGDPLSAIEVGVWQLLQGVIYGGALLTLLSIDERLEKRA